MQPAYVTCSPSLTHNMRHATYPLYLQPNSQTQHETCILFVLLLVFMRDVQKTAPEETCNPLVTFM